MKKLNILLVLAIILICCVGTVSATDTNESAILEESDVVEADVVDESLKDVEKNDVITVDESNLNRTNVNNGGLNLSVMYTVTNATYGNFFRFDGKLNVDPQCGALYFSGSFIDIPFKNFVINKNIGLYFSNDAVFQNTGFKLMKDGLSISGAKFTGNNWAGNGVVIYIKGNNIEVKNLFINVTAPNGVDFHGIDVLNSNYVKLLNNTINYNVPYANSNCYNYVIRVKDSQNAKIANNTINAYLPLKDVNFNVPGITFPNIATDLIAGAAIQSSNGLNFTNNVMRINVSCRAGSYPTLDSVIIVDSNNSYIGHNDIVEIDKVTQHNQANYLYAVDVYKCYNIVIDANKIRLNSDGGGFIVNNGTGAAYGVQLTGPHTGVVISNNNITTVNNGPNLGIYSQNYYGNTSLTIIGNNINVTGSAGTDSWSLVSGMELQDTYANVTGNNIIVNNVAGYNPSYNAYGISYAQWTQGNHQYDIYNNNVLVKNGTYAVYLMSAVNTNVHYNVLKTINSTGTVKCGDSAVYIGGSGSGNSVSNNYCRGIRPISSSFIDLEMPFANICKSGSYLGNSPKINTLNALDDVNSPNTIDQSLDLSIDDEIINVEDNSDDEDAILNAADEDVLNDEPASHVVYVGPNTGDGDGSYDNPFKTLKIAIDATEDFDEKLIIKLFEGIHFLEDTSFSVYKNLTIEPVSGEVILKPKPQSNAEIDLYGWYLKINNLIFDASDLTGNYKYYLTGGAVENVIYNCTFIGFNKNPIFYCCSVYGAEYIISNCKFIDIDNPTGCMMDQSRGQFKYCVFSANYSRFIYTFSQENVTLEDVWLGSNTIPSYFNITDDPSLYPSPVYFKNLSLIIKRHAIFSISENYINDTAYEIVGKLMWNDSTSEGIDQLGPMKVTLSSTTGELPRTAVLENGTFRVIYRTDSKDHTVTAKLDFEELELNFKTLDIGASVEDILPGQYANIVVTLPDNSNGTVNVMVNNKNYTANVTNASSVNITVDEILNEGEYAAHVTFIDKINHYYGETSTNFKVSKIEDYQINITAPSESKIGDTVVITINLPIDATGNVTIQVNVDKQNLTIINGTASLNFTHLKEGVYSVIVNYAGDNKYGANGNSTNFTVSKVETNNADEVLDITTPVGTTSPTFSINLPADATGNLTVTVDGKNYTQALVNGSATVNIPALSTGNHNIIITYSGDDKYASIVKNTNINIPKPKLMGKDIAMYYTSGYKYKILVTLNGVAVKGKKVIIKFNKKTYPVITDKNGYAILKLDAKPGKYRIIATYDNVKLDKHVTVKSIVSAKNLKVKKSAKTLKIKVSLKKVNGKFLKAKKLTLKFKGKTYKAKTNKKGVVTFSIKKNVIKKLKVGKKYSYKVSYLKDSVSKKITVKK